MPGTGPTLSGPFTPRLVPVELRAGAVRIDLSVGFDVPTLRRALEALGC